MNRLFTTLIAATLLSGCGIEDKLNEIRDNLTPTVSQWDGKFQESTTEFFIDYPEGSVSAPIVTTLTSWWAEVKDCTGFQVSITHAPLVIAYVDAPFVEDTLRGVIWLNFHYMEVVLEDVVTTTSRGGRITRHLMLHYLLHQAGLDETANNSHNSEHFMNCGDIL